MLVRLCSKTVNCVQDADKELWCIDQDVAPTYRMLAPKSLLQHPHTHAHAGSGVTGLGHKEHERHLARVRKQVQRDRLRSGRRSPDELDVWLGECQRVLSKLMRHQEAWPFCEAVDAEALELPDYYHVVQTPMDLGIVQQRLHSKTYTHLAHFVRDVSLTLDNALRYQTCVNEMYMLHKYMYTYAKRGDTRCILT